MSGAEIREELVERQEGTGTAPFNDTSGWLIVHPGSADVLKAGAASRERLPFSVWVEESLFISESPRYRGYFDWEWQYQLSSTASGVLWSEAGVDIWDALADPYSYRALYLLRSDRSVNGKRLFTVLDSQPARDLVIDPDNRGYDRFRELCEQPMPEPAYEQHRDGPARQDEVARDEALDVAERILRDSDDFSWLAAELECTGTTDPFVALALRPLIGQLDGWNQAAYDALRRSFEHHRGQLLHPDDYPLDGITYQDQST
ncbi:hypothetical protein [Mycobacteroides abscessus]|uniref:hypothetical protein n=1 Tax=Mycobacteroides abscessus TaxID=36809 RepID=UPI0019D294EF|nr:hypothetical protein [Mycobacteroides abscessus]QSN49797.1 hypothetical protein I3U33_27090 [Mycobacteroides abscessus subsp. abscessus]